MISSSAKPSASNAPLSRAPASTQTSFTSRRPSSANTSVRDNAPLPGQLMTVAPRAARAAAFSASSLWVNTSTSPGSPRVRACSGSRSAASRMTRTGWTHSPPLGGRALSDGSSASTVPMPVSTALARARQRCTSPRAAAPVIHWLVPLASAVPPSRLAASLTRTKGRP